MTGNDPEPNEPTGIALADLTQVDAADVYKGGSLAAHMGRAHNAVEFRYTDEWVDANGPAVALTLPVTRDIVTTRGGAVPAFFAGLLPEGRRLGALRRNVKTSADDEFSLVLAVGSDAVGDVQVVPSGAGPTRASARLVVDDFASVRFADLLADLDMNVDRSGIPGVQDKASMAMVNLPVSTAAGTFILKLNPPEFRHVVENEMFFLGAARASGLTTSQAHLVRDRDGATGLVVSRFDRYHEHGELRTLAVEDGCQVLGLYPEAKYRVSSEDLMKALVGVCEAPVPAARDLLMQLVFAYLSGNGDAHAKNFSVLQDRNGAWRPSPAYDIPSSQPYGDNTLALTVAGKRDGNIPGRRFVSLGQMVGMPEKAARRTVERIARGADEWVEGIDGLPFGTGGNRKLKKVVLHRQAMLLSDL